VHLSTFSSVQYDRQSSLAGLLCKEGFSSVQDLYHCVTCMFIVAKMYFFGWASRSLDQRARQRSGKGRWGEGKGKRGIYPHFCCFYPHVESWTKARRTLGQLALSRVSLCCLRLYTSLRLDLFTHFVLVSFDLCCSCGLYYEIGTGMSFIADKNCILARHYFKLLHFQCCGRKAGTLLFS